MNTDYPTPHNGLAWTYLLTGRADDAKDELERAIELDPEGYSYYFNLGIIFAITGDLEVARDKWRQGVKLCKGNSRFMIVTRAFYTVVIGDVRRGISDIQKIVKEGKELRGIRNALGDAEILAERCPIKIEGLDRALSLLRSAIASGKTSLLAD